MSSETALTSQISSAVSLCTMSSLWPATLHVTPPLDLSHSEGIAFYWWGSGGGDQGIDFEMRSPTGGWVGGFPDGPAEWRWVFLSWDDLTEVDLDGSRPDRSRVTGFFWTYHTDGVRRVDWIVGWRRQDLAAQLVVRHEVSGVALPELLARFEVPQGFNDLSAKFEIMVDRITLIEEQIVTGAAVGRVTFTGLDLNTHKTYKLIAEWQNPIPAVAGYVFLFYNGDEVQTNYESQYIRSAGSSTTQARYDRPDIAWSSPLECGMSEITIGISPTGYITALSISKTISFGSVELFNHSQTHKTVQANLTELIVSHRGVAGGYAENVGFEVGSKFRLYGYVA